jgi:hypothetical protein
MFRKTMTHLQDEVLLSILMAGAGVLALVMVILTPVPSPAPVTLTQVPTDTLPEVQIRASRKLT